ncbi:MAG: hypothetical protein H7068_05650 [Pedobacter sp.]|nr:hypothetical protein [Chitinophagaceae bacterium]
MKKITILFAALLICSVNAWSQKIKYEKSFEEAKIKSQKQNKPLAILIAMQPPVSVVNFLGGLANEDVASKFNNNFINYKIDFSPNGPDTSTSKIIRTYKVNTFPAFIFLDSKGGLMFKDFGNSTSSQKYLLMADKAIATSKEKSLVDFDEEYKNGTTSRLFLKEYILKRKSVGITTNELLIEKYADFLSVADLDDYQEVLFILQAGPLLDGKAYKLAYINRKIIDSIYKTEPLNEKVKFNNIIIGNNFTSAVNEKNTTRAYALSNFVRGTWSNNYKEGQKQSSLKMIQYYQAVKDTNNYLQQASYYYDQYYMNIGMDSIKKLDSAMVANRGKMIMGSSIARDTSISQNGQIVRVIREQKTVVTSGSGSSIANELNNAAWTFYLIGTKNTTYLTKALFWSKRSSELSPNIAAYYDTLAHLLYRLSFYAEAESTQEKAIEMAKQQNENTKQLQDELTKIKNKTL